ncbi:synapsin-1-like [Moschus berezovskii]|uniref:synapsin-1-like n=1 Tax=Moschus berezovskii TaxID=68408 RepID=UPI0024451E4F|nr:synapsin-1-like [Moschus berezovskii]
MDVSQEALPAAGRVGGASSAQSPAQTPFTAPRGQCSCSQSPAQTPFTAPRGQCSYSQSAPPRFSVSPDGPTRLCWLVHLTPSPSPNPGPGEGPPRGVHSKPPGAGPPEPVLVWACLPSRWDAPGQGALSMLTPVSPGPVRFVDRRTHCAETEPSADPGAQPWPLGCCPRFGSHSGLGPTLREVPFHRGGWGRGTGEADPLPLEAHLPPGQEQRQLPQQPPRPSGPQLQAKQWPSGG